jgi:hypothetical protein
MSKKPSIGAMTQYLHDEKQIPDLATAMTHIIPGWEYEYDELLKTIKQSQNETVSPDIITNNVKQPKVVR